MDRKSVENEKTNPIVRKEDSCACWINSRSSSKKAQKTWAGVRTSDQPDL
jgi:hypothetical protein